MNIMRKAIQFLLSVSFALFIIPFQIKSQTLDPSVILHEKMEEIAPFKSFIKSFDMSKGEEMLLNVEVVSGKRLSKLTIEAAGSPFNLVSKKIKRMERAPILVIKDGNYNFIFRNNSFFKKNVNIKIEKYPQKAYKDTIMLEDIIISTTIDTLRNAYADTIGLPDISQIAFELQPSLDYKSKSDSCISEILIDGEKYQFAVYWIGIGAAAKAEYDKLKSSPPPSWLLEGINEPIFAFAKGLTQKLPDSKTTLAKSVKFAFKDPNSDDRELSSNDTNPPYYGVIPVYKAGKYQKVRICFKNFNTTSKTPVYLLIAKYKLEKKEKLEIIKRERIQEIFIKRPVEYYKTNKN